MEKQQELLRQSDKLKAEQGFQQQLNAKEQELERRNSEIGRLDVAFAAWLLKYDTRGLSGLSPCALGE